MSCGFSSRREVLAGRNAVGLARYAGVRIGFGTDLMGEPEDEQRAGDSGLARVKS